MKERDAEHHIIAVDGDGVAVDGEHLVGDSNAHISGEATTGNTVPIGDDDTGTGAWLELETNAAGDVTADEVVGGPQVEEGNELIIAESDVDLHGVLGADARNGIQGDHGCLGVEWCRICGGHAVGLLGLLHDVIGDLKAQEAGTLVAV